MPLKPNRRILVLCEGLTEYLYAKSLQFELPRNLQRSITVDISPGKQQDVKSLVIEARTRAAKARLERNAYEVVWLFFDHDQQPQLKEAFEMIEKEGFKIAYSAICIEHWFILHFENCGKAFASGEEALKYLRKFMPTYHKTKTNAFKELRDRLEGARKRAALLIKNQAEDLNLHQKNPFFTINAFFEYFEQLKEEINS